MNVRSTSLGRAGELTSAKKVIDASDIGQFPGAGRARLTNKPAETQHTHTYTFTHPREFPGAKSAEFFSLPFSLSIALQRARHFILSSGYVDVFLMAILSGHC